MPTGHDGVMMWAMMWAMMWSTIKKMHPQPSPSPGQVPSSTMENVTGKKMCIFLLISLLALFITFQFNLIIVIHLG